MHMHLSFHIFVSRIIATKLDGWQFAIVLTPEINIRIEIDYIVMGRDETKCEIVACHAHS